MTTGWRWRLVSCIAEQTLQSLDIWPSNSTVLYCTAHTAAQYSTVNSRTAHGSAVKHSAANFFAQYTTVAEVLFPAYLVA